MNRNSSVIDALTKSIMKLPGIGPRSAKKVAFHLLNHKETLIPEMLKALKDAQDQITTCKECRNFTDQEVCSICSGNRDVTVLCLVRDNADINLIEATKAYNGRYYVLGQGFSPSASNASEILESIRHQLILHKCQELIVALNLSVESRTILYYVSEYFADLNIKITNLGMGISIGTDFEYIDTQTMAAAIENRQKLT